MTDTDSLDYRLTRVINSSYGLGISNARPVISGATIPKLKVANIHTTNIYVEGVVKTPLALTQPLMTNSGDLYLEAAGTQIDLGGSTISSYTLPTQNFINLSYQSTTPVTPGNNTLRIYADNTGKFVWKLPNGNSSIIDNVQSANRTFTFPDTDTSIVGTTSSQTLTSKTIDSASNTVRINGTNINTLVGQSVTTTASPSFVSVTLTNQLTIGTSATNPIIVNQGSTTTGNDLMFQKASVNMFSIGTNETSNETYSWTPVARDYKIATNNIERLRIVAAGIANDNTANNVIGLQGTTLVYKTTTADTTSAQTFTNKEINSASNTVQVNGTNVNSLIDQDVRTTFSPAFPSVSATTSINEFSNTFVNLYGSAVSTNDDIITLLTLPTVTDTVYTASVLIMAYCSAGPNANGTSAQRQIIKVTNVGGVLGILSLSNVFIGDFTTGLFVRDGGTQGLVQVTGILGDTIRWYAFVKEFLE